MSLILVETVMQIISEKVYAPGFDTLFYKPQVNGVFMNMQ